MPRKALLPIVTGMLNGFDKDLLNIWQQDKATIYRNMHLWIKQHKTCIIMKIKKMIILLFLLVSISCEKNNKPSVLTELKSKNGLSYNQSLNKWNELKNKNRNSYSYQTTFKSWTGFGNTTELKIKDGVIASRIYQEFKTKDQDGTKEIVDSYSEDGCNLGTHSKGALLLTIDDLYETCAKRYLTIDEKNNTIYFETGNDGLITMCGFVPNGCMDDCYRGVSVNSFHWLN